MVHASTGTLGTSPARGARRGWVEADPPWARWERLALGALLLLALLLRVAYVLESRASPFFDAPQMDALYHLEWARAFARGERFQEPPFFRAPLYPWFLGLVLRVSGDGLLVPRLVQALLGTGTVALGFLIARKAFGRAAALLAGLLLATSWVAIFHEGELLVESLAVPLYALGILLSMDLVARPRRAFVAGLVWGLGAITRPNILLFLPFLAVWLWLRARRSAPSRPWLAPLLLSLGTLLPIAPISAWNLLAGGDTVLIASQGGVNLWIGNHPASDGSTAIVPGTRADWWGGYRDAIAQAERAEGRPLRPSEVSRHYTRRSLEWIAAEPTAWLGLMGRKLRLLWSNAELGNNDEPRFLAVRFVPWLRASPWSFGWIAPLAMLGLLAIGRRWRELFPLWGYLATYAAGVALFFVNARFRLPLLPALAVLAAAGALWLLQAALDRRRGAVVAAIAACALLAAASYVLPAGTRERAEANGWLLLGQAEGRNGDPAVAEEHLLRAATASPSHWIAWRDLGVARKMRGDARGAEEALRRSLRLWPDDLQSVTLLCELLLDSGRPGEAAELAHRAVALAPHEAASHYSLGRAHFLAGDLVPAAEAFGRALHRKPDHFGAAYGLGRIELSRGRSAAAIAALRVAVECADSPPAFLQGAFLLLAEALHTSGDRAGAREVARRGLSRFPGNVALREVLER